MLVLPCTLYSRQNTGCDYFWNCNLCYSRCQKTDPPVSIIVGMFVYDLMCLLVRTLSENLGGWVGISAVSWLFGLLRARHYLLVQSFYGHQIILFNPLRIWESFWEQKSRITCHFLAYVHTLASGTVFQEGCCCVSS